MFPHGPGNGQILTVFNLREDLTCLYGSEEGFEYSFTQIWALFARSREFIHIQEVVYKRTSQPQVSKYRVSQCAQVPQR